MSSEAEGAICTQSPTQDSAGGHWLPLLPVLPSTPVPHGFPPQLRRVRRGVSGAHLPQIRTGEGLTSTCGAEKGFGPIHK